MDLKLELVCVPVSDVDKAKAFYVDQVGFVADVDHHVNDGLRFVQLTPPGSGCSICIGTGLTTMTPGTLEGLQLVVADADLVRSDFLARGMEVGEVEALPWGRFLHFTDPDGNRWSVQQILAPETG